jgi:peptide/nickel transport system substrate-binding protein
LAAGLATVALVTVACGSSKGTSSGGGGGTSGAGYTSKTTGSGSKLTGGTVYFAEAPSSPPNYIFPMYSPQYCGTNNIDQLNVMLFRPLFWYGDNYSPTVDYNRSIGKAPVFSNSNTTVSVTLNDYSWSDGEQVTARDVVFWMNVLKANPAAQWCGYVPGYFPDNVKSVSVSPSDPKTVVFQLDKAYNPTWFQYNELSQIYPMPLAWDRTSLSQPPPTSDTGNLPDTTKSGAAAIYKFLDTQGKTLSTWSSSTLWSVVDGPYKLKSVSSTGEVVLVPNAAYSGSPKATVNVDEVPFTDDAAVFNATRSEGTKGITIMAMPAQYTPQIPTVEGEGYTNNKAGYYGFNFFPLNEHNPKLGPIFSQTYFRQAFEHLVDQSGWVNAFLHNAAVPTHGPVPASPASPLINFNASADPFPFSISAASQLLSSHGWKVVSGGSTTCTNPGTGPNQCGAGITAGEGISFNLDYAAGVVATQSEMNDLKANASQVGITIDLTTHPFNQVYSAAVQCTAGQPTCNWTAENWGAGWIYGPDYYPSGEDLFLTGAVANYANWSDPTNDNLIKSTLTDSTSAEGPDMTKWVQYVETNVPYVYEPTQVGTFAASAGTFVDNKLGGYAANALGFMTPEDWYFTK